MTTPYPGPCSVLVMDNARVHHAQEIEDLVRGYGKCQFTCQCTTWTKPLP